MDIVSLAAILGGNRIVDFVALVSVAAPFALVAWMMKLKHDRRIREIGTQGLGVEDQRVMQDMNEIARRMEQRVENLERILDSELAGWRSRMPL